METSNQHSSWVRGGCIGRGSYGTVSLAVVSDRTFAVKSVSQRPGSEHQMEALENEIAVLQSISSPWVVEYLGDDTTVEGGGAAVFRNLHLEYMPGGTVADMAKQCGADVDESLVRSHTWCLVSALKSVHAKGIIHCDVKGKNVLIGSAPGVAKLADFGSATEYSATGVPRGSPLWMAPEVVRREYQGPESDIWSLGCTVIEMMTGRPAWEDRGAETLFRIGYSDELPEIPSGFSELGLDFVGKCLRRNRRERWTSDQLLVHPFISTSAPANPTHSSPRCVLDWFNSNYIDEDDESRDEEDRFGSVSRSGRERIGELACSEGAIWESDGWITVRNVITDRAFTVSGEGTSSGYQSSSGVVTEIETNILLGYSDFVESEPQCLEVIYSDDGLAVETVEPGSKRRRRWSVDAHTVETVEPGSKRRLRWLLDADGKDIITDVLFLFPLLCLYVIAEVFSRMWFVPIIGFSLLTQRFISQIFDATCL